MTTQQQTSAKQSRLGKRPIPIPNGVQVTVKGREITIKGPKGTSTRSLRPEVTVAQKDNTVVVGLGQNVGKEGPQYQGLSRALLANMIKGCAEGFKLSLDLRGVGYRAAVKGSQLDMSLGLSHGVTLAIPKEVKAQVETIDEGGTKYPRVHLESHNNEVLGQFAAKMRSKRPPEPYKGKGVRYTGERVREKAGKAGKAGK